jgi:hypothetical protein
VAKESPETYKVLEVNNSLETETSYPQVDQTSIIHRFQNRQQDVAFYHVCEEYRLRRSRSPRAAASSEICEIGKLREIGKPLNVLLTF